MLPLGLAFLTCLFVTCTLRDLLNTTFIHRFSYGMQVTCQWPRIIYSYFLTLTKWTSIASSSRMSTPSDCFLKWWGELRSALQSYNHSLDLVWNLLICFGFIVCSFIYPFINYNFTHFHLSSRNISYRHRSQALLQGHAVLPLVE